MNGACEAGRCGDRRPGRYLTIADCVFSLSCTPLPALIDIDIGNLSWDTRKEDLFDLFSKYGAVSEGGGELHGTKDALAARNQDSRVPSTCIRARPSPLPLQVEDAFVASDRETGRSRGFGFVTMEVGACSSQLSTCMAGAAPRSAIYIIYIPACSSIIENESVILVCAQSEGAQQAITEVNESDFMGRTIRVNEAQPRGEGGENAAAAYVNGIKSTARVGSNIRSSYIQLCVQVVAAVAAAAAVEVAAMAAVVAATAAVVAATAAAATAAVAVAAVVAAAMETAAAVATVAAAATVAAVTAAVAAAVATAGVAAGVTSTREPLWSPAARQRWLPCAWSGQRAYVLPSV